MHACSPSVTRKRELCSPQLPSAAAQGDVDDTILGIAWQAGSKMNGSAEVRASLTGDERIPDPDLARGEGQSAEFEFAGIGYRSVWPTRNESRSMGGNLVLLLERGGGLLQGCAYLDDVWSVLHRVGQAHRRYVVIVDDGGVSAEFDHVQRGFGSQLLDVEHRVAQCGVAESDFSDVGVRSGVFGRPGYCSLSRSRNYVAARRSARPGFVDSAAAQLGWRAARSLGVAGRWDRWPTSYFRCPPGRAATPDTRYTSPGNYEAFRTRGRSWKAELFELQMGGVVLPLNHLTPR
jgi:hypothetical protein